MLCYTLQGLIDLLGLAENFGIWYLPSGYKDAIAFIILFIFLLFKPQGILNKKKE